MHTKLSSTCLFSYLPKVSAPHHSFPHGWHLHAPAVLELGPRKGHSQDGAPNVSWECLKGGTAKKLVPDAPWSSKEFFKVECKGSQPAQQRVALVVTHLEKGPQRRPEQQEKHHGQRHAALGSKEPATEGPCTSRGARHTWAFTLAQTNA
jgi:hypothetical protein